MPTDNIEEIKSKLDIVDVIQEYLQLKPAGTNNLKANCPFHQEKTPSFVVSRDKQIWHCFGCGEGGDILTFVQKMEGLEFPETLRILAKKAGVQLQYQDPAVSNQKTKLLDINKAAADMFHRLLLEHPKAQFVREYLEKRGMRPETIETWQLGFAPEAWDVLYQYLSKKGFQDEDIFQAGLTLKKDRGIGFNDRFRNRLMFPIQDPHGSIVGFGGRWLGQEEKVAKYINTPQTQVYDKSRILYGIDKAKTEIKKQDLAVVVEGYMDCIASHQAGVHNVVASSGTALTSDQIRLIKRFSSKIAFAFDMDVAGDTAAKRGIDVAWQEEMSTKVIVLPEGVKDPDELIVQKGADAWTKAIGSAVSIMDYYFETVCKDMDLGDVEDKKKITRELLPVINKLADPIERTHYIQKLATLLKVDEGILADKMNTLKERKIPARASDKKTEEKDPAGRSTSLSEELLGILLAYPDHLAQASNLISPEYLTGDKAQELYKLMVVYYTKKHLFDYKDFIETLSGQNEPLRAYAQVLTLGAEERYAEFDENSLERLVTQSIQQLRRKYIQGELIKTEQSLKRAEADGDDPEVDKLSERFTQLTDDLRQLQ